MDVLTGIGFFVVVAVVLIAGVYVMKPEKYAGPVSIALVASRPVDEQTAKAHLGQKSGLTNATRHQDDARRCSLSRLDPSQT